MKAGGTENWIVEKAKGCGSWSGRTPLVAKCVCVQRERKKKANEDQFTTLLKLLEYVGLLCSLLYTFTSAWMYYYVVVNVLQTSSLEKRP